MAKDINILNNDQVELDKNTARQNDIADGVAEESARELYSEKLSMETVKRNEVGDYLPPQDFFAKRNQAQAPKQYVPALDKMNRFEPKRDANGVPNFNELLVGTNDPEIMFNVWAVDLRNETSNKVERYYLGSVEISMLMGEHKGRDIQLITSYLIDDKDKVTKTILSKAQIEKATPPFKLEVNKAKEIKERINKANYYL